MEKCKPLEEELYILSLELVYIEFFISHECLDMEIEKVKEILDLSILIYRV